MQLHVNFVGAQANEKTPDIALYSLDIRGQAKKIAAVKEGNVNLTAEVNKLATIALGPDVADPKTLDPKSLVTLRVSDYLHQWEKNPVLEIPAQWWRPWLGFRICLTGKVNKCFPLIFEKTPLLRSMALGNVPYHLPWEICSPVCNGVVEVWESTCCCFPFLLVDVPPFIEKLKHFLAQNPVMFPHPPRPGPITPAASRTLETSVDRAIAQGKTDLRFTPNTQLHLDLQVLESSSPAEAVQYFQTHPSLWPIWCECSSAKLGETALNPDGTFQFCYWQFLFPWLFCWRSYFYKVKQFQNGSWVYIYDGAAAHQYFTADEIATLSTFLGYAEPCPHHPEPILSSCSRSAARSVTPCTAIMRGWTAQTTI